MFRIDCNFERAFAQGTQIQDKDKQIFQPLEKNALQFTKTIRADFAIKAHQGCQTNDYNLYFKENPSGSDCEVFLSASAVCLRG